MKKNFLTILSIGKDLPLSSIVGESEDLRFKETSSLQSALSILRKGDVDFLVLEMTVPERKGNETIKALASAGFSLPAVAVVADDKEEIGVHALSGGAQDYLLRSQLTKPQIIRSIRYAIETYRIKKELASARAKVERLSLEDPLTGVLNRHGLQKVLSERETAGCENQDLAVIINIDDFKKINTAMGHAVGDVVLSEVTRKIQTSLRALDHLGRIGGDEFMALLPDTAMENGQETAEKIRQAVNGSPIILASGKTITVTASLGVVSIPNATPSLDELLRESHRTLSASKRAGKNKVSLATRGNKKNDRRTMGTPDIRVRLRQSDGYMAVLQSIYRLSDLQKIGYEFLSRSIIEHFKMPDEFFRASMENNILTSVDRQCLKTCVAASAALTPDMHCHVNLFPSTMIEIPVRQILDEFPDDRMKKMYCIEISEQQIIGDPSYLAKPVQEIKRSGMLVAIDDVGFGRSCLENLILLEPDIIKIDKRCVSGIANDLPRAHSLKRILSVAEVLKTEVVAEGIESQEDLDVLKDLGVKYGQGFFLDKPAALNSIN